MTSEYAQKRHIKKENSLTGKIPKFEKLRKWLKLVVFVGPRGPNFDHFFTIFCKSLLNVPPPKNHYATDPLFTAGT